VLVGDGGVGKSRLGRELLRMGAERGFATARTVGTRAAATVPLGALAPLLPPPSGSSNLLAEAVSGLTDLAAGATLMLLVDDAHLLDEYSATLLVQLALSLPSFVVVTVRAGEPFSESLVTLWKEGLAQRIEVLPLDDVSVAEIASQALGGPLETGLAALISARAAGNPLAARELAMAGLESGAITRHDSGWRLTGQLAVSERLIELVTARLGAMNPSERGALEAVAFGEPLGVALAGALAGHAEIGRLEQRGILVAREDGRRRDLWLSHPIHSEVVRATTSPLLAAGQQARIADVLEGTGMRRRGDLRRVAALRLESGVPVDPDLLLSAATETRAVFDMAGTARFALGAWEQRRDFAAGLLAGTSLSFLNRFEEADAMLAAAAGLATTGSERATAVARRSFVLATGMRLGEEALALVDNAIAGAADAGSHALLKAQRAVLLARARLPTGEVLEAAEPLLADASPVVRVLAAYAVVIALVNRGGYDRAIALATSTLPEHRVLWQEGLIHIPPELLENYIQAADMAVGRVAISRELLAEQSEALLTPGRRSAARWEALVEARAALIRGKPLDMARILGPFTGGGRPDRHVAALMAISEALLGNADGSAAWIAVIDQSTPSGPRPYDALLDEARAWSLIVAGRPEEARRVLRDGIEQTMVTEEWGMTIPLLHDLARFGDPGSASAILTRIGDDVDGEFPRARRTHVAGLALRDAAILEEAAGMFETIGADLIGAEAALDSGRAWARAGDPRRATRMHQRSRQLLDRCQGASSPALLGLNTLVPLTDREREVALLAITGIGNKEIAERLFVSVRTVDNHLQHVYEKLGVKSRAELGNELGSARSGARSGH
jgi:DNA-binding CsgD family transcriptional regulator